MIYFFYGDDTFSLLEKVSEIKQDFKQKHPQGNIVLFEVSSDISDKELLGQLKESLQSQGLFSAEGLVVVENLTANAKQFPKTREWLMEEAEGLDQRLVLAETEKIDKRIKEFKALKKLADTKEFSIPTGKELEKWIIRRLKSEDFSIHKKALAKLTELLDPVKDETLHDLWQVENELKKLMLYKLKEKEITEEDVTELVRPNVSQNVFNLTNLFAEGKGVEAVRLMEEMIGTGKEVDLKGRAIQIIGALASQARSLLLIKSVKGTQEEIAKELSWKSGRVWITRKLAGKFEEKKLKQMLRDLNAIDRRLKTSDESPKLLLELFLQKSKV